MSSRRITVTVRNVLSWEITLKSGMPIAYLFPVDVALVPAAPEGSKHNLPEKLTTSSFNFGDSPLCDEWNRRLRGVETQMIVSLSLLSLLGRFLSLRWDYLPLTL